MVKCRIAPDDDKKKSNMINTQLSYPGNWCVKPTEKILPCARNLFGRGPMQDCTTQKHDFPWKCGLKEKPIKYKGCLCLPRGHVEGAWHIIFRIYLTRRFRHKNIITRSADNTTYKLSFFNSKCTDPVKSFKPIARYEKSDAPLEDYTTYRLSYFENEAPAKVRAVKSRCG